MRRSNKETILLDPNNRLLNNGVHESHGMNGSSFAAEAAQEWASGHVQAKQAPRKPIRS